MKFTHKDYFYTDTNDESYIFIGKLGFLSCTIEKYDNGHNEYTIQFFDKNEILNNKNGYSLKFVEQDGLNKKTSICFYLDGKLKGHLKGSEPLSWSGGPPRPNQICFDSIKHWKRYVKLQVFK